MVQTFHVSSTGKTYRAEKYIFVGDIDQSSDQNEALMPANPKSCTTTNSHDVDDIDGTTKTERPSTNMNQFSPQKKQHVITIDYSYLLQQKSALDLRHNCCAFL